MNGRDLTLGALAGLAVAGMVAQRRSGSRDAASEQGADYFDTSRHYNRAVKQSGRGVVSGRFPSWESVRRRLQKDGFAKEDGFDNIKEGVERFGEDLPDREKTRLAWEEVQNGWERFVESAWDFTDPIRIWRAVTADGLEALRLPRPAPPSPAMRRRARKIPPPFEAIPQPSGQKGAYGAGVWWSWDPYAAEAHWGGSHARGFRLAGEVAFEDVNWPATFYANLLSPEEREIQVKPDAPVYLLRVRDDKTGAIEKQDLWVRA